MTDLVWPQERLAEAMEVCARRVGLRVRPGPVPPPPAFAAGPEAARALEVWMEAAASWMGVEAEPVTVRHGEVAALLRHGGPALVALGEGRTLVLLGGGRVVGPDLRDHRLPAEAARALVTERVELPAGAEVDRVLDEAGVPPSRRAAARRALLDERLRTRVLAGGWLLRPAAGAPFADHVRARALNRPLVRLLAAHGLQYVLFLLGWVLIGRGALGGRLDAGWLLAWALVLAATVPLRAAVVWQQGKVALGWGAALKQRLLVGALRTDPEEVRHLGVGAMLGQVVESEAVEQLALNGGFAAALAGVDLAFSIWVLRGGAAGELLVPLLVAWIVGTGLLAWGYHGARARWTSARVGLTRDLVERMVGHRTRLAQEPPARWHDGEDGALARYFEESGVLDRAAARLQAGVSRSWTLAALAALGVAFVPGAELGALAVAVGGVLWSARALASFAGGAVALSGAAIAWRHVAPLYAAASRPEEPGLPAFAGASPAGAGLLVAHQVGFRWPDRPQPVLAGVDLDIRAGDRILLEGPSGGGKSTLASVLVGLRRPQTGLLLLHGLDRGTLGDRGWRRHAVAAPQFHENRVLMGTFAFNALLGRGWPPTEADLREAAQVVEELGLGPLLARMPGGLAQVVGESGWQLSHGEKSRLYLARALLQDADLVVLDETFGALDPENLERALRCALARAKTLVVIAHP